MGREDYNVLRRKLMRKKKSLFRPYFALLEKVKEARAGSGFPNKSPSDQGKPFSNLFVRRASQLRHGRLRSNTGMKS